MVTSATSKVTADTNLFVKVPPVISDNSTRSVTAKTGDTITLSCFANGNPTPKISWRRENNGPLPTGGVISKGNTITIYDASKGDRGTYYCLAENGVGRAALRSVGVEIEFGPQLTTNRVKYKQAIGHPVELHCAVEAYPSPDISWIRDGYQINNDNNFQVLSTSNSHEFTQSTLRIRHVDRRDFGSYKCRAINRLGDNTIFIHLEEVSEPLAEYSSEYSSVMNSASMTLNLCRVLYTISMIVASAYLFNF